MHLEYTPGYGETLSCRASEGFKGPLRRPPPSNFPRSMRGSCLRSLRQAMPPTSRELRPYFYGRGSGALERGEDGGFRFNDSAGAGWPSPEGRLKIESATSRRGGPASACPRRESGGRRAVAAGRSPAKPTNYIVGVARGEIYRQGRPLKEETLGVGTSALCSLRSSDPTKRILPSGA